MSKRTRIERTSRIERNPAIESNPVVGTMLATLAVLAGAAGITYMVARAFAKPVDTVRPRPPIPQPTPTPTPSPQPTPTPTPAPTPPGPSPTPLPSLDDELLITPDTPEQEALYGKHTTVVYRVSIVQVPQGYEYSVEQAGWFATTDSQTLSGSDGNGRFVASGIAETDSEALDLIHQYAQTDYSSGYAVVPEKARSAT